MNSEEPVILVVDDNPTNLNVLLDVFDDIDYEVLFSSDGKSALEVAVNEQPDLILLDVMMPGMDGFEVCHHLKKDDKTREIPVIFMTALSDTEAKIKGFNLGAVDYITKPYECEEVLARVNTHLTIRSLHAEMVKLNEELRAEKERNEQLLLNILPPKIVNDLIKYGNSQPETFENVSVLFADVVEFTKKSAELEPDILIDELSDIFSHFDEIINKNRCERIKTIGDAYLGVSGMPLPNDNHAQNSVQAATEIIEYLERRNKILDIHWEVRIGIHSGKVVGGIIGLKKYVYDVFGDTINTTARIESYSEPMKINVSETVYNQVKDKFRFIERGPLFVKGKGKMKMYFVDI